MFKVVSGRRKERVVSRRTIVMSAGAHLLLLGGFLAAAEKAGPVETEPPIVEIGFARPKLPPPPPPPPAAAERPAAKSTAGGTVELRAPVAVPDRIPPVDVGTPPLRPEDLTGIGRPGDHVGTPPGTPAPPTGNPEPGADPAAPLSPTAVDVLPALSDPRSAQRMLEREYPPLLRDAGVTGHTTVTLVIDRDGNVVPGSVKVDDTTNDEFRAAAIRVAEKFHFRPARLHGQPVSVIVSLPIDWRLQS